MKLYYYMHLSDDIKNNQIIKDKLIPTHPQRRDTHDQLIPSPPKAITNSSPAGQHPYQLIPRYIRG